MPLVDEAGTATTGRTLGGGELLARAAGRLPTTLDGEPWTPGGDWLAMATRSLLRVTPLHAVT